MSLYFRGSESWWYYLQHGNCCKNSSPTSRATYNRTSLTIAVTVLTMKSTMRFKNSPTLRSFRSKNMVYHILERKILQLEWRSVIGQFYESIRIKHFSVECCSVLKWSSEVALLFEFTALTALTNWIIYFMFTAHHWYSYLCKLGKENRYFLPDLIDMSIKTAAL